MAYAASRCGFFAWATGRLTNILTKKVPSYAMPGAGIAVRCASICSEKFEEKMGELNEVLLPYYPSACLTGIAYGAG
eukprot:1717054-Rhodomonas_salina.1